MRDLTRPNLGRRGSLVVLVVLAVVLAIACSADREVVADFRVPPSEIGSNEVLLYVSNQSYEDPDIQINVTIDGEVVVDDRFLVDNQHNWVPYLLRLSPGKHLLRAESSTGATFEGPFETLPGQPRWAVLDYWNESGEEGKRFVLTSYDELVRFY
ncbi:MAG: hypothetical protein OEY98_00925 [Acidimicrobiia bacterium]|nr:hypothetical protein [Acidimicrobiia bacterium]